MSDMTIDAHRTDDGDALLGVSGELDLSHVDTLWNAALGALESTVSRLIIDLSAVTFLDSSILGMLVRIQRKAEEQGAGFALRGPSAPVLRLLSLTGLDGKIVVEP